MEDNKNLQGTTNQKNTEEKKKTAADIVLEKLNKNKEAASENKDNVDELRQLQEDVKNNAQPDIIREEDDEEEAQEPLKMPNYNEFTREELVARFEELLKEDDTGKIVKEADLIKKVYYKKRNEEVEQQREKFVEEGGKAEDFKPEIGKLEEKFNRLLEQYKLRRQEYTDKINTEKERNLELKRQIIEKIEKLTEKSETLKRTFEEFYELREEWKNIGPVPQSEHKALLEKYNFTLQKFYDWVKINKELRDLDLKRNLELKTNLCEEAEALLIEPKITKAYKKLQKLHEKWKEIGPVPSEFREEIWERFQKVSSIINRKHYEYFKEIHEQQLGNLKAKELLCQEAEKIAEGEYEKSSEWHKKTEEMNELMKLWKMIGFAPKKYNNQIFERFISARKKFFERKHEYFQQFTENLEKNLQEKEQLVVEAENAKDSTDWKKTTDFFIELQKRWKEIGRVPNSKREEIWQRFNSACNYFFERKREYFKQLKEQEDENLKKKQELIERIKAYEPVENPEENLQAIQNFQKQWTEIGFVPIKYKNKIYKEFKKAIDAKLKALDLDEQKQFELEIKNKIESFLNSDRPESRIRKEIEYLKNRISSIHNEIITLENNMSFFVKSKSAEKIINNFKKKINRLENRKETFEKALLEYVKALKSLKK